MNNKLLVRLLLDLAMVILIILAFAYLLSGHTLHELIGVSSLFLVVAHNVLNRRWYASLLKGKYNLRRSINTAINFLLLVVTAMLFVSGLMNSEFLPSTDWDIFTRQFHAWAAYWVLILVSVHLGMHWKMVMNETLKAVSMTSTSRFGTIALRAGAIIIVAFGVEASFDRSIYSKLTAYYSFDYWDFDQPVIGFFVTYLSIMGVYVCLTYYGLKLFKKRT